MKEGIHPKYVETKVICGCGNSFTTRSTSKKPELKVDILHRQAEVRRHGGPDRAVQDQVCRHRLRQLETRQEEGGPSGA